MEKNTDQAAVGTANQPAVPAARFERSELCTHGDWVNKKRVLGLQCNCQWALSVFSRAARFISKLDRKF